MTGPAGRRARPTSAAVRQAVGHPVVAIDGHLVEHLPEVLPFVREHLAPPLFDRFAKGELASLLAPDPRPAAERAPSRTPQSGWWGLPTRDGRDRATAMLPGLLHERMDELGLDLAVLYPTLGFGLAGLADDELRQGLCAGWNAYLADVVAPYRDRLRVAGIVPMHTPEEAIAELERCAALGIDVVGLPHGVVRPIPAPRLEAAACLWPGLTHWLDTYGLDSEHDYDPVWARCGQLRLPVTLHGGLALDARHTQAVTSFVWNHLGLHASMMDQVCRSLVLGGVTHRFPDLPFAFLEGGVGWAALLAAGLVEHWERRSPDGLAATDPAALDVDALAREFERFGRPTDGLDRLRALGGPPPAERDEWRHTGAADERDVLDRLVRSCWFGCEGGDRTVAFAFSPALPHGVRLQAAFSSDLGHWDVESIGDVVAHAHRHVEDGLLTDADFRDLVFANPARLFLRANPAFFAGTPVEPFVAEVGGLSSPGTRPR